MRLVASVKQAGAIRRGELEPGRVTVVRSNDMPAIHSELQQTICAAGKPVAPSHLTDKRAAFPSGLKIQRLDRTHRTEYSCQGSTLMARKVFLSFTMEDRGLVDLFRTQVENGQSALVFRDYPIKETFEYAWKTNAERLIRSCSATVCLIGKSTHQSKAVDWEIRKSVELGKSILAVAINSPTPLVRPLLRSSTSAHYVGY